MSGDESRWFYQRFNPQRWESELCPELVPVLRAILAADDVPITQLGYANIKAPELVLRLARAPSAGAIAAARQTAAGDERLVFTPEGIGCRDHFAEIDWPARTGPSRNWWRRLFG